MIYTSYYSKRISDKNAFKISISRKTPPNSVDCYYTQVAPDFYTLYNYKKSNKTLEDIQKYKKEYIYKLEQLYINQELKKFINFCKQKEKEGKNIYLLCYENPNDFCHRHLLANFINKKFGLSIQEYNPQPIQQSLFD